MLDVVPYVSDLSCTECCIERIFLPSPPRLMAGRQWFMCFFSKPPRCPIAAHYVNVVFVTTCHNTGSCKSPFHCDDASCITHKRRRNVVVSQILILNPGHWLSVTEPNSFSLPTGCQSPSTSTQTWRRLRPSRLSSSSSSSTCDSCAVLQNLDVLVTSVLSASTLLNLPALWSPLTPLATSRRKDLRTWRSMRKSSRKSASRSLLSRIS